MPIELLRLINSLWLLIVFVSLRCSSGGILKVVGGSSVRRLLPGWLDAAFVARRTALDDLRSDSEFLKIVLRTITVKYVHQTGSLSCFDRVIFKFCSNSPNKSERCSDILENPPRFGSSVKRPRSLLKRSQKNQHGCDPLKLSGNLDLPRHLRWSNRPPLINYAGRQVLPTLLNFRKKQGEGGRNLKT